MTRRLALLLALSVVLLVGAAPVAAHGGANGQAALPAQINLPPGFQPEGITAGRNSTFYVGSLANGAIYRGDLTTGAGAVFIPGVAGLVAVGTEYERRHDRLWVAGGATGQVRVYNATTGALLMTYTFPAGFLNDLVVHRNAVYVTNSPLGFQHLIVIPLGPNGELPTQAGTILRPLTGDLVYQAGFNVNGIASAGRWLVVVQSNTGFLFRVDPATGATRRIDLGGYLVLNGDGVEVRRHTIWVVRNRDNLVAVLNARPNFLRAKLKDELTSAGFDVPTTAIVKGKSVWAVNARFPPPPLTQPAPYWITRVTTKH